METEQVSSVAAQVAREIESSAAQNDRDARFSIEAVEALGAAGLLGLLVPRDLGGAGLGPQALGAVTAQLAGADASVAMVFLMHSLATAVMAAAPRTTGVRAALEAVAAGHHLSTLAFSEARSRSHFWAPVSRGAIDNGGVRLNATKSWVTSAGHAQSYVVSSLSPNAAGPTDSTLYLVPADSPGLTVSGRWEGMGLRANASAPMLVQDCYVPADLRLTGEGAGFTAMLQTVLPLFNLGSTAVSLGICRAAVSATIQHLKAARFEHLGVSLGESLPNLRAQLAEMQIETDGLACRLDDLVGHLEQPSDATMLRVLESKASAGEAAIKVTSLAMRTCGGAAFSRHSSIERLFRDAHAGAVMAPTGDVLREFIGKALLGIPLF